MIDHTYLQVALYKKKTTKSIYEVKTGIACNCYCPICGNSLEAKNAGKVWNIPLKDGQRIAHFAHSNGSNCESAGESMLHKVAKDVLFECKELKLPPLQHKGVILKKSSVIQFDKCIKEERVPYEDTFIKPDVILTKNGKELYVEFFKTHLVDDNKIEKIKELKKSTIEIDLNEIPILKKGEVNREGIKENLIESIENRYWLYNNQIDKLYKNLKKSINKETQKDDNLVNQKINTVENISLNTKPIAFKKVKDESRFDDWKRGLLKQGFKFLKVYKSPEYEFDDGRKIYIGQQELVYCPKLKKNKFPNNRQDIIKCSSCEFYKNKVKNFKYEWSIACFYSFKMNTIS